MFLIRVGKSSNGFNFTGISSTTADANSEPPLAAPLFRACGELRSRDATKSSAEQTTKPLFTFPGKLQKSCMTRKLFIHYSEKLEALPHYHRFFCSLKSVHLCN